MSTLRPSLVRMAPAAALLALTAIAAPSAGATDYVVQAGYAAAGPHPALSATLHGAAAQPYALLAETNLLPGQGLFLGLGTLDDAQIAHQKPTQTDCNHGQYHLGIQIDFHLTLLSLLIELPDGCNDYILGNPTYQ